MVSDQKVCTTFKQFESIKTDISCLAVAIMARWVKPNKKLTFAGIVLN